jgi:hypothetical protein
LKAAPIVPTVRRLFNKKMRRTSSAAFFILSIRQVRRHFAKTRLKRVLENRCPAYSGYHLWYPIVIGSMRSSERVGLDASSSVTHQHRGFRVCQHLICDTAEHNCG